jgi:hypothetical protein
MSENKKMNQDDEQYIRYEKAEFLQLMWVWGRAEGLHPEVRYTIGPSRIMKCFLILTPICERHTEGHT